MSKHEEEVRVEPLIVTSDEDYDSIMEEMHYHNTINAFVELIVVYGYDKVIWDLRTAMENKEW